jgi:hypothetical protein
MPLFPADLWSTDYFRTARYPGTSPAAASI